MDEIIYTYEDIVTDTSVLNEAPDFFEEGKVIHTGHIDDQPQAVSNFLFGDEGLSVHPHTAERRKYGWYYSWDKIEGVFDMEYEVPEKTEWLRPYVRRSKVYLKVKVEYDKFPDSNYNYYKVYRLDENDNVI